MLLKYLYINFRDTFGRGEVVRPFYKGKTEPRNDCYGLNQVFCLRQSGPDFSGCLVEYVIICMFSGRVPLDFCQV